MKALFGLTRDLFKENPPVVGDAGEGRAGGAGAAMIAARKREWVAQRVAELSEVAGCMLMAGYYRYRVSVWHGINIDCGSSPDLLWWAAIVSTGCRSR